MNKKHKKKKMLTLFSRIASASAFASSAPIPLYSRLRVVSVYDRKCELVTENGCAFDVYCVET
jgi:hypothetical protein